VCECVQLDLSIQAFKGAFARAIIVSLCRILVVMRKVVKLSELSILMLVHYGDCISEVIFDIHAVRDVGVLPQL
jgi:hypothetical protein